MTPITIELIDGGWVVKQGDKYADQLGYDEMLGLLVSLTYDERFSRSSWMHTKDEHEALKEKFSDKIYNIEDFNGFTNVK